MAPDVSAIYCRQESDLVRSVIAVLDQQPRTYRELDLLLGRPLLLRCEVMWLRRRGRIFYCPVTRQWSTRPPNSRAAAVRAWLRKKARQLRRLMS